VTTIQYDVPSVAGNVSLVVYDLSGRVVRTLLDGPASPGSHAAVWDGKDGSGRAVASGVYYCRMRGPDFEESVKLTLIK